MMSIKHAVFLAGLGAVTIFNIPLAVADATDRFISVTGKGEMTSSPDTAWVTSGISTRAKTAVSALDENNTLMRKIVDTIIDADVDKKDIQTSGFSVRPVYDYSRQSGNSGEPSKLVGYQVSNNVTVKITNIGKLGDLLDDLVEAGSNQISGIRFGFEDDEALLDEARKKAIANAHKKAKLYADAADVDVGDVVSISETATHLPRQIYQRVEMKTLSADSVPVMGGEQEISAGVTVVYYLED